MKWKVVVDISPKTVPGTNDCHMYVFNYYRTKSESQSMADVINAIGGLGRAFVEKRSV